MEKKFLNNCLNAVCSISEALATNASAAVDKARRNYEQQQVQARQQQIWQTYLQNAVYVSHDLAYVLQQVRTDVPLHDMSDFRALDFLPERSTSAQKFVFAWYKKVRYYDINRTSCENLMSQINRKICQIPAQLTRLGYTSQKFEVEYPALYRGMEVTNILNTDDGILLQIHVNC